MTVHSGLGASLGFGDESSWGVAATPTVFVPLREESLTHEIERVESEAIIAGQRVLRSTQWMEGNVSAGGDVGMDLNDQSKGLLLKHMFGGSSTTGPFSPADIDGLGLTCQVGVPDVTSGTVRPKTLIGGKVASWEVGLTVGEVATLGLSLIGKKLVGSRVVTDGVTATNTTLTSSTAAFVQDDVGTPVSGAGIPSGTTIASVESGTSVTLSAATTASASGVTVTIGVPLASASYASNLLPMSFRAGLVSVAGADMPVREITLAGDNGLADDRRFLGSGHRAEPVESDLRAYTGTIETDYFSDVAYRRFLAGAEAAVVLTVARGSKSVVFTTNVRFDGESPQVGGRGVVGQTLPFVMVGSSTDASAITVTLDET